jgi:hypothetical protein
MKNEKDLINTIATMYAMSTNGAGKREKDLAKFILSNYYGVDTFFLNREGDYSSGLNLEGIRIFSEQMKKITKTITGDY